MRDNHNLDLEKQSLSFTAPEYNTAPANGAPPLFVSDAGKFFARKDFFVSGEKNGFYLLLYTVSGKGEITFKNETHSVGEGDAALIDCAAAYEYCTSPQSAEPWVFYWMLFSGSGCDFYVKAIDSDGFFKINIGNDLRITSCFETVFSSLKYTDIEHLCFQSGAVTQILTSLISSNLALYGTIKPAATHINKVSSVVAYIDRNYWQPLALNEFAKRAGMSKYYFLRIFKEYMGMTPYQYIILRRITEAEKLLRATDLTISEVSIMSGFRDEAHFNRTFKKVSGTTPLQYRKNH